MQEQTLELIKKEYEIKKQYFEKTDKESMDDLLFSAYMKYISSIKEEDTNGIYVFLKTDVVNDKLVNIYWNIEQSSSNMICIEDVDTFEKEHAILYPTFNDTTDEEFVRIQKTFIRKAVDSNQEKARKLVIRRYNNKNNNSGIVKR